QHRSQFHVASLLVVLLGLALERLIIQEQSHQRGSHSGLGQLGEASSLNFQSLVAAMVGGFLDGLDRFNRRRVVRASLTGNETLGGFESHHLLNGVELDLFQLGLTLGAEIQLTGNGAAHHVQRRITQLAIGNHSVHSAHFQRIVGTLFSATGNPFNGVVHTNQTRQADGATETGIDTQLGFRQADLGALRHDAEVASQAHFQTTTQRQAIDGSDCAYAQVFESIENAVGFQVGSDQLLFGQLEGLDEFGDVGTHDEDILATGDNDAGDAAVGLDAVNGRLELGEGGLIELVDRLALQIEPQFGDAVFKDLNRDGFTFVNHQLISTL